MDLTDTYVNDAVFGERLEMRSTWVQKAKTRLDIEDANSWTKFTIESTDSLPVKIPKGLSRIEALS